jgi:ribosome biogenesis protein Tsr3
MPEIELVRKTAEGEHLDVVRSVPWSVPGDPTKYGRLSSLKSVPELCDAALYRIAASTVGQAVALAKALV